MPNDEMEANSEQDLSNGYRIKIEVLPDGFKVSDPEPLDENSDYQDEETIPDLTAALKNIMKVVNDNPVSGGEKEGFASVDQPSSASSKMA